MGSVFARFRPDEQVVSSDTFAMGPPCPHTQFGTFHLRTAKVPWSSLSARSSLSFVATVMCKYEAWLAGGALLSFCCCCCFWFVLREGDSRAIHCQGLAYLAAWQIIQLQLEVKLAEKRLNPKCELPLYLGADTCTHSRLSVLLLLLAQFSSPVALVLSARFDFASRQFGATFEGRPFSDYTRNLTSSSSHIPSSSSRQAKMSDM